MKNIFIILLCVCASNIFAQETQYKRCLDGEIIRWSLLDGSTADWMSSTEIVAYGDTLFNGAVYKKLYLDKSFYRFDAEPSNTNWKNHTPQLHYEWENFFIRESEDFSKLYLYSPFEGEEFLISDMDLQEGDIIQIFVPSAYINVIVDSIYIKKGLKHIDVYDLNSPYYYITFIESVGPDTWFNYPYDCSGGGFLNCFQNQSTFYKNNSTFYGNYPCGAEAGTGGINTDWEDNFNIFVQKNKIEIVFTSNMNVDISIYNLNGILLYERSFLSQNIVIPTAAFVTGIYILKVLDKNTDKQYTSKIIL